MPTRYWLVGARAREAVSRLESAGGVRRAEQEVDPDTLAAAHARYAAERDRALPPGYRGARPSGGVGGTRTGVKCLHAHLAWYLAGGRDPVGRWVAGRLAGELPGPVAAIDLGSNSTRMLVLAADGTPLARTMTITRLAEGLAGRGALAPAALERVRAALAAFVEIAEGDGATRFGAVATAAARDATNAEELLATCAALLGTPPVIVSGAEEAELAYAGATAAVPGAAPLGDPPFRVLDVGGGSTEVIRGARQGPPSALSLPLGCVRVTEAFLHHDPPTQGELAAARAHARAVLGAACAAQPDLVDPLPLIGVAGTVAALCALAGAVPPAEHEALHGRVLARAEVEALVESLAAVPLAERRRRVGLEPERAAVIVGGGLVLAAALEVLEAPAVIHSTHDLLDGLAHRLLLPAE